MPRRGVMMAGKTMSDFEKLKALLTEFGVGFGEGQWRIVCESGGEKVTGYSGLFTEFTFDGDGSFIEMGAYESVR
jgi:hypothetical protein